MKLLILFGTWAIITAMFSIASDKTAKDVIQRLVFMSGIFALVYIFIE